MIDLSKTACIMQTFPEPKVRYDNFMYLDRLYKKQDISKPNIMVANHKCSLLEARNRTIKNLVKPMIGKFDWFVFIDDDITLRNILTDLFFEEVETDIVGCNHPIASPTAWLYPDQFHMGLVRIRSHVFEAIDPPWFEFVYNEDNTNMVLCDCGYFRKKVLDAGFTISRQGYADHADKRQWHGG